MIDLEGIVKTTTRSKHWDPLGNVILQAGQYAFRIRDDQSRFDKIGSSVGLVDGAHAKLVTIDSVDPEDIQGILSSIESPRSFTYISKMLGRIPSSSSSNIAFQRYGTRAITALIPTTRTFAGTPSDYAEDALILAVKYDADIETRKRLWYHVVTTREFHGDEIETSALSPELRSRCTTLLNSLISHFTALLFTPPATSHMECTDVFADKWMDIVIQPSLENDGVYKPLESLGMMKSLDWRGMGVCESCVKDKHVEWDEEADNVWKLLGDWLQK